MFSALFKAFAQLSDPRLRGVLVFGIVGAAAAYLALVGLAWALLADTSWFDAHWADSASHLAVALVALVAPLPFFPALATTVMSFRLEAVAEAVDQRHYPKLNWPRPQKWSEVLVVTLRFLGATVVVNLVALPLYGLLLLTGFAFILSLVINGYLLGREYFELVALRRLGPKEARILFRNRLGQWWLAGAVIALLFTVPLLNLAAPVLGAALMVHRFQALRPPSEGV